MYSPGHVVMSLTPCRITCIFLISERNVITAVERFVFAVRLTLIWDPGPGVYVGPISSGHM